jgi:hypothetical protein
MLTVVTCAEDELAANVAQHLFKRALAEESSVDHVRANADTVAFESLEGAPGWTLKRDLKPMLEARTSRVPIHPPRGLGGNALRAYQLVRILQSIRREAIVVLLLAYDRDGRPDEQGLRAGVRAAAPRAGNVVVAEAQPEFDAWVLCGFVPQNHLEQTRWSEWERRLKPRGIDLLRTPERLTSDVASDVRDAKVVAQLVLGLPDQLAGDEPRVVECLERPLSELRSRGAHTGLPEFLDEARQVVDATQRP